jgi:hypothetical protein
MILKLRRDGSIDRPMASVVRSHRKLIDNDRPIWTLHELHSKYSDDTEFVSDPERELLCRDRVIIIELGGRCGRLDTDAIALDGFRDRVRRRLP